MSSKGELEAAVSHAVVEFWQEHVGRGPQRVQTHLLDRLVLVYLWGALPPTAQRMAAAPDRPRARELVKQTHYELIAQGRPQLQRAVEAALGAAVVCLHTDVSTHT